MVPSTGSVGKTGGASWHPAKKIAKTKIEIINLGW
jgi:hypothetical protein